MGWERSEAYNITEINGDRIERLRYHSLALNQLAGDRPAIIEKENGMNENSRGGMNAKTLKSVDHVNFDHGPSIIRPRYRRHSSYISNVPLH